MKVQSGLQSLAQTIFRKLLDEPSTSIPLQHDGPFTPMHPSWHVIPRGERPKQLRIYSATLKRVNLEYGLTRKWAFHFNRDRMPKSDTVAIEFLKSVHQACFHSFPKPDDIRAMEWSFQGDSITDFPLQYPIYENHYYFHYCLAGSATLTYENAALTVSGGQFLIIPPALNCRVEHNGGRFRTIWGSFADAEPWAWTTRNLGVAYHPIVFSPSPAVGEKIHRDLNEITQYSALAMEGHRRIVNTLFELILLRLGSSHRSERIDPRIARSMKYLSDHYMDNVPLDELAKICNLSPSHFGALFRRETGMAPHQWLLSLRMNLARELLAATTMPVGEVAARIGYPDQRYFARVFRKMVGISPSEYRLNDIS